MTLLDDMLKIRIPGPFVVLQGLPGDGLVNTMDSLPTPDIGSNHGSSSSGSSSSTCHGGCSPTTTTTTRTTKTNNIPLNVLGQSWPLSLPTTRQATGTSTTRMQRGSSFTAAATTTTTATTIASTTTTTAPAIPLSTDEALPTAEGLNDSYIVVAPEEHETSITNEASISSPPAAAADNIANATTKTDLVEEEVNHCNNNMLHDSRTRKSPRHSTNCSPLSLEKEEEIVATDDRRDAVQRRHKQKANENSNPNDSNDMLWGQQPAEERQAMMIDFWHYSIQEKAGQDYHEWHEDCNANQCTLDSTLSRQHAMCYNDSINPNNANTMDRDNAATTTATTTTTTQQHDSCWWIDASTRQLAVLSCLPDSSSNKESDNNNNNCRVIGSLAPGTTIIATALHTLSSVDGTPLQVTPLEEVFDHTNNESGDGEGGGGAFIYPAGQVGWIQVLEMEYAWKNHDDQDVNYETITSTTTTTGYVVLSRNGYSFLGPGLLCSYCDPLCWMWRVTCIDGAFVREGLDLCTRHLATIPHGALLQVHGKTVNSMGLSRLQISAVVNRSNGENDKVWTERITGWCSEFLNPLSGQRGLIVRPLPFPVPALYRVTLPPCAVIRSDIELSSPEVGQAPVKAILSVTGRAFSEHPSDRCIDRLRLAGNGGWVSLRLNKRPPEDLLIVDMVGLDPCFEPGQAGRYHLDALRRVQRQQQQQHQDSHVSVSPIISSAEDYEEDGVSSSTSSLSSIRFGNDSEQLSSSALRNPTYTYTARTSSMTIANSSGHSFSHEVNRSQPNMRLSSTSGTPPTEPKCLICLCEDRTATIIHGGTGHIACCLMCARILKARGDPCPVCRLSIDAVIQHFWA